VRRVSCSTLLLTNTVFHRLQALSTFIQTQKALLTRTQNDIERLRVLRDKAIAQPSVILDDLEDEVSGVVVVVVIAIALVPLTNFYFSWTVAPFVSASEETAIQSYPRTSTGLCTLIMVRYNPHRLLYTLTSLMFLFKTPPHFTISIPSTNHRNLPFSPNPPYQTFKNT
jgi:hypothetical protein